MRRLHYVVGLLGVSTFVLTGQVLRHHDPPIRSLDDDVHLMFVSRHIYLLGAALVNLMLGLYLRRETARWRQALQVVGSVLLVTSPLLLFLAFFAEPSLGLAGRSWRSASGLYTLVGGASAHFVARASSVEP